MPASPLCAASGSALPRLYELWLSTTGSPAAPPRSSARSRRRVSNRDLRLQYNRLDDGALAALQAAAGRGALSNLWYLGVAENPFTDDGLRSLAAAIRAGALPKIDFVTAATPTTSADAQREVQAATTHRPR